MNMPHFDMPFYETAPDTKLAARSVAETDKLQASTVHSHISFLCFASTKFWSGKGSSPCHWIARGADPAIAEPSFFGPLRPMPTRPSRDRRSISNKI